MSAGHRAWVEPASITVEPGQAAECTVWVENTGDVVDEFSFEILGAASAWSTITPAVLGLFPGAKGSVTVRLNPPRAWHVAAGSTPFAVRVMSRTGGPETAVVEEAALSVGRFSELGSELTPQTSRGFFSGRHSVRVVNSGNAPVAVSLSASDPENALRFRFRPSQVSLAPGAGVTSRLRAGAPLALASEETRQFEVAVVAEGEQPIRLRGMIRQRKLPVGTLVKWGAVAAAVIVAAIVIPPRLGFLRPPSSTPKAGVSAVAPSSGQPGGSPSAGQPSGSPSASAVSPSAVPTGSGGRPQAFGFVWADQPLASGCYTPSPNYQYNTTGAANTVCHAGTGSYSLNLPNLGGPGGMVNVTAYGSGPESCKVTGWFPSGSTQQANVACFNAAGAPADTYFAATFTRTMAPDPTTSYAYLWADQPGSASYTPNPAYQWNSTGASNTITHTPGSGDYTVHLPNLGVAGGHVQVTAYGTGSERCKVVRWGPAPGEQQVEVTCFNVAGAGVDSRFTMTYALNRSIIGPDGIHPGTQTAYAWANLPATPSYAPSQPYTYNAGGSANGVSRISTGTYTVQFPSFGANGDVQVTAYGLGSFYCKVSGWSPGGVGVRCFTAAGALADSSYTVTIMRQT